MAKQNFLPGFGFVNEINTKQNLLPGMGVVNETETAGASFDPALSSALHQRLILPNTNKVSVVGY